MGPIGLLFVHTLANKDKVGDLAMTLFIFY